MTTGTYKLVSASAAKKDVRPAARCKLKLHFQFALSTMSDVVLFTVFYLSIERQRSHIISLTHSSSISVVCEKGKNK
jgi:hypothetical protein